MTAAAAPHRAIPLRLAFYYGAFFAIAGVSMPYWPVWLESRGLGPVEIGIVLAAGRWISIATTPMIAHYADRKGERKRILTGLAIGVFVSYALYNLTGNTWQILLVAVPAAIFHSAIMPVGDSLTMTNAARGHADYGRVRLWGSVTFILASFAGGQLLAQWPEDIILWTIMALCALGVGACLFLPDTRTEPPPPRRGAFWLLARQPVILRFLGTMALLSSSHAVVYAFGTLHWRQAGISDRIIGLLWAEGVIAEILLFAVGSAVVRRLGPTRLMLIAAAGGLVRWATLGATTDLTALFIVQALHALTFGAAHLGAMNFVVRAAPEGYSATAQSLYNALAMSGTIAITVPLMGPVFEAFGGGAYYVMCGFSLAGGVMALSLARKWDGGRVDLPAARPPE
jgi:PPP family 3-phenylpropionic acid transporter